MKFTTLLMACLLMTIGAANAQKIGYANVEGILSYMPESKTMAQQLQLYGKQLKDKLTTRENYLQEKYADYQEKGANLMQQGKSEQEAMTALEPLMKEIEKLQAEVEQTRTESEEKLAKKQQELQGPILDKLKKAIKEVATEQGYTYVFNSVDGAGVSILLEAPEKDDLTETIMKKLGIEIPKETPAPAATGTTPAPAATGTPAKPAGTAPAKTGGQ